MYVCVCVSLPSLHPLSSDTTSIMRWPFETVEDWECVCDCRGRRCGACHRTPTSLPPCAQWSCPGLPTGCWPALMPPSHQHRRTLLRKITNNSSEDSVIFMKLLDQFLLSLLASLAPSKSHIYLIRLYWKTAQILCGQQKCRSKGCQIKFVQSPLFHESQPQLEKKSVFYG